eukprot:201330-Rhodomonas_salina.1
MHTGVRARGRRILRNCTRGTWKVETRFNARRIDIPALLAPLPLLSTAFRLAPYPTAVPRVPRSSYPTPVPPRHRAHGSSPHALILRHAAATPTCHQRRTARYTALNGTPHISK